MFLDDASHSSNIPLKMSRVKFEGSRKHCAEQCIHWLYQKEFIDPVDLVKLAMKRDITLFGKFPGLFGFGTVAKETEKAKLVGGSI